MRCVIDTSALSWMGRIKMLDLMPRLYDQIYAPPAVLDELIPHRETKKFEATHLIPIRFESLEQLIEFNQIVQETMAQVGSSDLADVEVAVAHKYYVHTDEALYANKDAENRLANYGPIRDIANLFELAEAKGIYTRKRSIKFLRKFLKKEHEYRTPYVESLLKRIMDS